MKEKFNSENSSDKLEKNIKLNKCVTAAHPEMIRNSNADEPCDDDR